jgi:hypothetical protein
LIFWQKIKKSHRSEGFKTPVRRRETKKVIVNPNDDLFVL